MHRKHMKIEGAVVTDAGRVRSGNEDNYNFFGNCRYDTSVSFKKERKTVLSDQMMAAVFDGMGGEEAGEVASLMAARYFVPCTLERIREEASRQVMCANQAVCGEMQRRGGGRMGTTAVLLYFDKNQAVCCNVGDSRCYFMRKGILQQISVDHSEAEHMVRMGLLKPENARQNKSWHKLTQHLGIFPEEFVLEPYFSKEIALQTGDLFLLCSDGLTDMVMDEEIAGILENASDVDGCVEKLVETALAHGGRDNVTAMCLRVGEPEVAAQHPIARYLIKMCIVLLIAAATAMIAG